MFVLIFTIAGFFSLENEWVSTCGKSCTIMSDAHHLLSRTTNGRTLHASPTDRPPLPFYISLDSYKTFGFNFPIGSPESCFFQRCLGCHPQETVWPGNSVDCQPSNWVSAQWVHNLGHPPPSTDSRIPIEMRCLKMVATPDDKSFGNTVDTIRGCVPRAQVDSVCLGLVAVERARGHSDARCFICYGDNCNSAFKHVFKLHVIVLSLLLYYILR